MPFHIVSPCCCILPARVLGHAGEHLPRRRPFVDLVTPRCIEWQDQIIREQDQGLEALRKSIGIQKRMGMAIGEELDDQNGEAGPREQGAARPLWLQLWCCYGTRALQPLLAASPSTFRVTHSPQRC